MEILFFSTHKCIFPKGKNKSVSNSEVLGLNRNEEEWTLFLLFTINAPFPQSARWCFSSDSPVWVQQNVAIRHLTAHFCTAVQLSCDGSHPSSSRCSAVKYEAPKAQKSLKRLCFDFNRISRLYNYIILLNIDLFTIFFKFNINSISLFVLIKLHIGMNLTSSSKWTQLPKIPPRTNQEVKQNWVCVHQYSQILYT